MSYIEVGSDFFMAIKVSIRVYGDVIVIIIIRFCFFIGIFGVKYFFFWWFYENDFLKFWKCWILRLKVKLDVKNLEIIIGLYFRFTV